MRVFWGSSFVGDGFFSEERASPRHKWLLLLTTKGGGRGDVIVVPSPSGRGGDVDATRAAHCHPLAGKGTTVTQRTFVCLIDLVVVHDGPQLRSSTMAVGARAVTTEGGLSSSCQPRAAGAAEARAWAVR